MSDADVRWFDSHCHLDPDPDRAAAQVDAARTAGVHGMITVGTTLEQSRQAIAAAAEHDGVWATVGLHPHDATDGWEPLTELLAADRVVAIGECGLDYHYDHSPRDVQRDVFAEQVTAANTRGMPLVIHTREAWEDTFAVLASTGVPERTIFHCFTGGPDEARRCLDLGTYLSFSGIVTFPTAGSLREAAQLCPLDRMLVETDSPYLAPVPLRGRRNEPANVPLVGEMLASLHGTTAESIAAATWRNTVVAFSLPTS